MDTAAQHKDTAAQHKDTPTQSKETVKRKVKKLCTPFIFNKSNILKAKERFKKIVYPIYKLNKSNFKKRYVTIFTLDTRHTQPSQRPGIMPCLELKKI